MNSWAPELLSQLRQALDLLEQYRCVHAELGVAWPTPVSEELQRGIQRIEKIARLREGLSVKYGSGVAQLNVTLLQREWAKAEKTFWPMSWLEKRKVRRTLESVIEGADEPRIVEDLAALVEIKNLRDELGELNPGVTVEGLWAGEKTRTDYARSALKANAALLAARAQRPYSLEGLSLAAEGTDEDSTRGVEEICEQELLSLARTVISSGKSGEEALIAMAREIGLMKLRATSRGRLEAVLNVACR